MVLLELTLLVRVGVVLMVLVGQLKMVGHTEAVVLAVLLVLLVGQEVLHWLELFGLEILVHSHQLV
jgi:hypothetical protein